MRSSRPFVLVLPVTLLAACNVDVPIDPAALISSIQNNVDDARRDIEDVLTDPLDIDPYPILVGGDSAHVYYATNLADIRLDFPGPTNDIIIPGFTGPTNIYAYDVADKQRQLIRPLLPSFAANYVSTLDTDGRFVAYLTLANARSTDPRIVVLGGTLYEQKSVLYSVPLTGAAETIRPSVRVENARVFFVVSSNDSGGERIRITDLAGIEDVQEIRSRSIGAHDVRGDRLAYVEESRDGTVNVVLRDLASGDEALLAENLRTDYLGAIRVFVTNNTIIWSQPTIADGISKIIAYDLPEHAVRVLHDAAIGDLTGATDEDFITEEYVYRRDKRDRIVIHRYTTEGREKELADFVATGLAGQSRVIGHYAAWVTPERKVVLAPLNGRGDRISFRPY